ncbi:MAG TPA: putative 2OG-Fe(II) oxygenase [Steroidobacteraceae bacterium]|nr:putative 2OG-Fe(II) oxygenase [Steroidobacteraceae bacterium]
MSDARITSSGVPDTTGTLQLVVSLANSGRLDEATVVARSLPDSSMSREAWSLIAAANANLQRFGAALDAIGCALDQDQNSRSLRLQRALLLERAGRAAESLDALDRLAREADDSPGLLVHLARALHHAGRSAEAQARIDAGLTRWPIDVGLLRQSAELAWAAGAGADCVERIERAIAEHPAELQLRLVAADILRAAGDAARGLALVEEAARRAPGVPAFETSMGVLLGELGRAREALPWLRSAIARLPQSVQMRRNLLPVLLRAGEHREALALAEALLPTAPDDQQLIAYLAAAMRLTDDARYPQLQDYPRLVRSYRPEAPAGFTNMAQFNAALARELGELHGGAQRPLSQSIRSGTQTGRNLPADEAGYPVIAAFLAMLAAPIDDYVARLGAAPEHPTDRRRRERWRIAGSWSVRLQPGGFHTNHVHPQGWISSAYYVELPSNKGDSAEPDPRAGWLKFGDLAPAVAAATAEHYVEPAAGMLVLFPSFFWHGTVPFTRGDRRLTAAFDVIPE